ncbi:MAG TPA: YdeI/OmpD-associated family protein [Gaiella sp.]
MRFEATLRSDARGRVYLPLPAEPEVRHLAGTVNGMGYRGAVESIDGSPALVLGPAWRRGCGLAAGDHVAVELEPEGPQRQNLAPDLAAALDASPAAAAFWDGLAQFYRRAYLRWIDSTKRNPALRQERIVTVVALLERGVKERP